MHFDLTGHVALITGGNGGIGLGMARGLARAGASVAIWGRDEEKNRAAVAVLEELGADGASFRCDVSDEAQVRDAMAATLERFTRVDSCFANAGFAEQTGALLDTSLDAWNRMLTVNLTGVFLTFREAVRHMLEREGGGSLVATSSIGARYGIPTSPHYAASKAGLGGLVRSIAVEHGKRGIRANVLEPGWIETEMTEEALGFEPLRTAVIKRTPARRWGTSADFEAIAVYLATPHAPFHNGDTVRVDGGYSVL